MAPTSSAEAPPPPRTAPAREPAEALGALARETLLAVGRRSVLDGVRTGRPCEVASADVVGALAALRASFVTLRVEGALRGCIGALEARLPLVCGVAENAWKAASRDPRFRPVGEDDLDALALEISVLSPLEPLPAASAEELAGRLRPGRDGLVLRQGSRAATFLPAVWADLPDAVTFVRQLQRKAGLRPGGWAPGTQALVYTVEHVPSPTVGADPQRPDR